VLTAALLCVPLSAQAPGSTPQQSAPGQSQQPAEAKPFPTPMVAAAVDPNSYKIGADDVLEVRVWKEPDLSRTVRVRPDGKISLMLVGDVQAAGLTPMELQKKCVEAFSQLLNSPQVDVSVTSVESKKYYVSGTVGRSGPFPLVGPLTVLDALSISGLGEWAKKGSIVIMRGSQRLKFNYKDVIHGKNLQQNILLQDGDHIYVP
jgi:polysaccharide export outer membrane protein